MGNRKSAAEKLDENILQEIVEYFTNHTAASTIKKFNLNRSMFSAICKKFNLSAHTSSEAELFKHLENDGYDCYSEQQKLNIAEYYKMHSMTCTCEEFKVKEYFVRLLIKNYNIQAHTTQEEIDLTKYQKYGFVFSKTKEEKEQIELDKYGQLGLSGKEKAAITNKKLYGVENVFANKDIIKKLNQTKLERYGDEHYTNRDKAKQTCLNRYGTETYLSSETAKTNGVFIKSSEARKIAFLDTLDDGQHELFLQCYNNRELLINIIKSLNHNTTSQLAEKLNITRNLAYSLIDRMELFDYIDLERTKK